MFESCWKKGVFKKIAKKERKFQGENKTIMLHNAAVTVPTSNENVLNQVIIVI